MRIKKNVKKEIISGSIVAKFSELRSHELSDRQYGDLGSVRVKLRTDVS